MSLPTGQQRTLDRIERALHASEPHLAAKFAIFSDPVVERHLGAIVRTWPSSTELA